MQHIVMPPHAIIIGMPLPIMVHMVWQHCMNMSFMAGSIGIISQVMPVGVIVQVVLHIIIGIMPPMPVIGFIMGFIPGIMPIGIIAFIIGFIIGIMPIIGMFIIGIAVGIVGMVGIVMVAVIVLLRSCDGPSPSFDRSLGRRYDAASDKP